MPGPPEMLIILVIVILLFGAGKISRLGREMGEGVRAFRHAVKETDKTE